MIFYSTEGRYTHNSSRIPVQRGTRYRDPWDDHKIVEKLGGRVAGEEPRKEAPPKKRNRLPTSVEQGKHQQAKSPSIQRVNGEAHGTEDPAHAL